MTRRRGAILSLLASPRVELSAVRFLLPLLLSALVCAGCSSAEKKAARAAEKERIDNSRAVEQRRMRAIDGTEIVSERAAEIYVADPHKTFDPQKTPGFGGRSFNTTGSRVKEYNYAQRFGAQDFRTKEYSGSKGAWAGDLKFETAAAQTKGEYATKPATMKSAPTKDAREASKTMATRTVPGSDRAYLGPEAAKMKQPLDQMNLPKTSNDLREIKTIEDIRELLNKNK